MPLRVEGSKISQKILRGCRRDSGEHSEDMEALDADSETGRRHGNPFRAILDADTNTSGADMVF